MHYLVVSKEIKAEIPERDIDDVITCVKEVDAGDPDCIWEVAHTMATTVYNTRKSTGALSEIESYAEYASCLHIAATSIMNTDRGIVRSYIHAVGMAGLYDKCDALGCPRSAMDLVVDAL